MTNQLEEVQELWTCAEGEKATRVRTPMMKEAGDHHLSKEGLGFGFPVIFCLKTQVNIIHDCISCEKVLIIQYLAIQKSVLSHSLNPTLCPIAKHFILVHTY